MAELLELAGNSLTTATATTTGTAATATATATTTSSTAAAKPLIDMVAPVVSIQTDFSKPFERTPLIEGRVVDSGITNVGVAKVEYSIDNGKNWLPVDNTTGCGSSSSFNFLPTGTSEDGNYKIIARATDPSGNRGASLLWLVYFDHPQAPSFGRGRLV